MPVVLSRDPFPLVLIAPFPPHKEYSMHTDQHPAASESSGTHCTLITPPHRLPDARLAEQPYQKQQGISRNTSRHT